MLQTSNKRLCDFYAKNPELNFESLNLVLLDFLEQLNQDMAKVLQNTFQGQLMAEVRDLKTQFSALEETLGARVAEGNRTFLDTIKLVVSLGTADSADKTLALLEKHTDAFLERMSVLLPKTQEETARKFQEQLLLVQRVIQCDLHEFVNSRKEQNLGEFLAAFDAKLCALQQPLFSLVQSTQEHTAAKLGAVKEELVGTKAANEKLYTEMSEFLYKHKASSQFKGQFSENLLCNVLTEMLPTAHIEDTTALTASGDFIIHREGFGDVLVENKNYERNVDLEEVRKFLRDVTHKKCSGLMLSQLSGIVSKPNFFIEVHDNRVLVYLHHVHFSKPQIQMALDVIDQLGARLRAFESAEAEDGVALSKDALDRINGEVQGFLKTKEAMAATIRESQRKLLAQLEELTLPELTKFLGDKFATVGQDHVCGECKRTFTSKRSLAAHKGLHKKGKLDA
jgi:hypothetical protein